MGIENRFAGENVLFITGRLAEPALREVLQNIADESGFSSSVQVMPITVAALMTPEWIAKHLNVPRECDRIVLPGYVNSNLDPLTSVVAVPVEIGPKDLRRIPEFLGNPARPIPLDEYDIQIIAEINQAPQLSVSQIIDQAGALSADGADVIDVGCLPGMVWSEVNLAVRELVARGHRVSIDSLNPREISPAVEAGAELVLSVNSINREAAADWNCEVVVIPDDPGNWLQLVDTIEFLDGKNVALRIDPILEPIGMGFAESIGRYLEARRMFPELAMMMGIGNLTELSDVDSAGVNFILLAICQELEITSVLTTQVINWARSSVKECDIARRLVFAAQRQKTPPKNLDSRLICLRDPRTMPVGMEWIRQLAGNIRDNNYRLFAEHGEIHLLGSGHHWHDHDPFELFHKLLQSNPTNVDASHAFYLGYEMCKAALALQLGKQYEQDESLQWGHLTKPETNRRRLNRHRQK